MVEKDMTWYYIGAGMTFVWCLLIAWSRDRRVGFGSLFWASAFWPLFFIVAVEQIIMMKIERKHESKAQRARFEAHQRKLRKLLEGGPIRIIDL